MFTRNVMITFEEAKKLKFSSLPCDLCGYRHQTDAFEPRQVVRIINPDGKCSGHTGVVVQWQCWPGNIGWVRVEIYPGDRYNYRPCELEAILDSEVREWSAPTNHR